MGCKKGALPFAGAWANALADFFTVALQVVHNSATPKF
jgi:hypothetical protein